MLSQGLSAILDAVGVVLLAGLVYLVMFAPGYSFQSKGLTVGAIGLLSRLLAPGSQGRFPIALLLFVAVATLSSVVNQWARFTGWSAWPLLFAPVSHLFVMIIFIAGASHLLRTRRRLSLFMIGVGTASTILAIQTLFDQSINGFHFQPSLQVLVPSAPQWGGLHDLAWAFSLLVPIALAPAMIARTWRTCLAGTMLAALPVLASIALGARSQVVVVIPVLFTMLAMTAVPAEVMARHRYALIGVAAAALSACLVVMVWKGLLTANLVRNLSGRTDIWQATWRLIREEPWLGVGPGQYANALIVRGLSQHVIGPGSAHNLLLHIAAETGVFAAALWATVVFTLMQRSWRISAHGEARMLGSAVFFLLAVMVIQWTVESFIEGSFFVERHRILAWSVLAAALAAERAESSSIMGNAPVH